MLIKILAAVAALAMAGTPALAKSGPMQPSAEQHGPAPSMMDKSGDHHGQTARQLNRDSLAHSRMQSRNRMRDRMDRRAYMSAMARQHRRAANRYDRRYIRQQNAYARAMAAWRRQVYACHRGNRRACKAHSPRVSDFY